MSYMLIEVKCKKCKFEGLTAFGIVGTSMIAEPLKECPDCKGEIVAKYPVHNPSDSIE